MRPPAPHHSPRLSRAQAQHLPSHQPVRSGNFTEQWEREEKTHHFTEEQENSRKNIHSQIPAVCRKDSERAGAGGVDIRKNLESSCFGGWV